MFEYPNHVLALDFETTGITQFDHPNSLTIAEFMDGEPTGVMLDLKIRVPMKGKLSIEALAVQLGEDAEPEAFGRLVAQMLGADKLNQKDAMAEVYRWSSENNLQNVPVVAQNVNFDRTFYDMLARNTTAYKGSPLSPVWICTIAMARAAFPDQKSFSLDSLAMVLGIPPRESKGHDSRMDALKCGEVYFKLRDRLSNSHDKGTCPPSASPGGGTFSQEVN